MNPMMGQGQPQQGGMDPNQLMQMLMGLLTQAPQGMQAGNSPRTMPPATVPADILNSDPIAALMPMLQQLLAQSGMMQGGQQMQNGQMGTQGGQFGGMGGRPPGGSVPPSAVR
jgi:hypothetical protein